MIPRFTESHVEEAALSWLDGLGYGILHGPDLAPGETGAKRARYQDVLLIKHLRDVLLPKLLSGETRVKDAEKKCRERCMTSIIRLSNQILKGSSA
jgi:hypothetical protein